MKFHFWIIVAIVLSSLAFLLVSLYSFLFDVEYNKCEMTYMFEFPQFIPVQLPQRVQKQFPEYKLIIYNEGNSPASRGVFEGVPLLFIPGNDGSHRQVRSLASVALRMRESLRTSTRFDCFAVDLNSEMSALHGPFLYRQSEFVRLVIDHIESLYPQRRRFLIPLVGHSMGGLIARYVLTRDGFDRGRVPLILTLATPHQRPVIGADRQLEQFYAEANAYWRQHKATTLGHVTLVSLGGGGRDVEVPLELTRVDDLALERRRLWLSTEWARGVWAATDHKCIVWCKQLVLGLSRSLFASAPGFEEAAYHFRRQLLPAATADGGDAEAPGLADDDADDANAQGRWYERDLADARQRSFVFERQRLASATFLTVGPLRLLAPGQLAVALLDGAPGARLVLCARLPGRRACRTDRGLPAVHIHLPPTGLHRRAAIVTHSTVLTAAAAAAAAQPGAQLFLLAVMPPTHDMTELIFEVQTESERQLQLPMLGGAAALAENSLLHRLEVPAAAEGREVWLRCLGCRSQAGGPGSVLQRPQPGGGFQHAMQYFGHNCSYAVRSCTGDGCSLLLLTHPHCRYDVLVRWRAGVLGAAALRRLGARQLGACVSTHIASFALATAASAGSASGSASVCLAAPLLASASSAAGAWLLAGAADAAGQLALAACSLPAACLLLLLVRLLAALLSLLSLLARAVARGRASPAFAAQLAAFLPTVGCGLVAAFAAKHCGAAAIVLLAIVHVIRAGVIREQRQLQQTAAASRLYQHQLSVCSLVGCLLLLVSPSLVVWVKGLAAGRQQLAGADPHQLLSCCAAVLLAVDAALCSWAKAASPIALSAPAAAAASVAFGFAVAAADGSCVTCCHLLLVLLAASCCLRCLRSRQKTE